MKYYSSELQELVDVTLTSENTNILNSHRIKSVKGMKELLLRVIGSVSSPMLRRCIHNLFFMWESVNLPSVLVPGCRNIS